VLDECPDLRQAAICELAQNRSGVGDACSNVRISVSDSPARCAVSMTAIVRRAAGS